MIEKTMVVTRDMSNGMTVEAIRARDKRTGECGDCDRHRDVQALLVEVDYLRTLLEDAALSLEAAAKGAPMSNTRLAAEIARAQLAGMR
jgi:hypothetical protein